MALRPRNSRAQPHRFALFSAGAKMALGRTQLALERSAVDRLFGGFKQKGMSALVEDFKQRSFGLTRLWAQRCGEITG
jgi:hypothetical protein